MRTLAGALAVMALTVATQLKAADPIAGNPAIIPAPVTYHAETGTFRFTPDVKIAVDPEVKHVGEYLADLLAPAIGGKMTVVENAGRIDGPRIVLRISAFENRLGAEGYAMTVTPDRIEISSAGPAGAFYACQTLRQMMPVDVELKKSVERGIFVPACAIEDQPQYSWRGAMVDTSRHFFPKETILREIDLLALHKMNVLHLHLNDDQGWRIEIRKYPELTRVGAWRKDELDGLGKRPPGAPEPGPESRYGGFYTQDDLREIVAYAKSRYVAIVPEMEMPAHAKAALRSYPDVACAAGGANVKGREVYCAGKEETFTFIENVLDEVCDIFPGTYIHVGGDECDKTRWKTCPLCQARMKANGLKNENELQSYFIKRIEAYLETKHRRLIGWNEILQGGLPENATVMSWQGSGDSVKEAAGLGHDVVMCPESHCYFDHFTTGSEDPKKADFFLFDSSVPLNRVYSFKPAGGNLTPEQARHVLGAQGNLWSEQIPTQDRLDLMMYPRMCALSEALWTGDKRGDYGHFADRLQKHFKRLDALGVKYYDDPMSRADVVWAWQPEMKLPKETKEVEFEVTKTVKEAGDYDVWFTYFEGEQRMDIGYVALFENGKEVSREAHEGFAGLESQHNRYRLKVDHVTDGAMYTVKAGVKAAGPETRGQALMVKYSGEEAPTTQPIDW